MRRLACCLAGIFALFSGLGAGQTTTVREALKNVGAVIYPDGGPAVDRTVAEEFRRNLAPQAAIEALDPKETGNGGSAARSVFRIAVAGENFAAVPPEIREGNEMFLRLDREGNGELVTSKPHLLYALFRLLLEEWLDEDVGGFAEGKVVEPRFTRLEGGDNYLANPKWIAKGYDAESSIRELARLGYSHVPVNALAKDLPAEQGPPGEIYARFYYFSPDLDQFVETPLNAGAFSPEYLQANLSLLKKNAALAVKYGLTPGLNISSPRSVPDTVLEKYPYLRGARVDHPFRSYKPRYTLTLSHPLVRWHYAELARNLMREIPELGYFYIWTNDSGSGFEYTASLYAGRNGGAYLVREWKSHEDIARAAGENVLRYFRTLRDAARETNPDFRILSNLFSFANEERTILEGITEGLDLWVSPQELDDSERGRTLRALPAKGSEVFTTTRLTNNYLLGIPFPWLAAERTAGLTEAGFRKATVIVDPPSLAPRDVNREVLRALNFESGTDIDALVAKTAAAWGGKGRADALVRAWRLVDAAVREFPDIPLYGDNNWGFPWYRLFVRPYVPDIGKIPEADRAYYEKWMTVTFNNPNLVDLATDILWTLMTREDTDRMVAQADRTVWTNLDEAITVLDGAAAGGEGSAASGDVCVDQRDRVRALRCYFRTLRNTAAWVSGVHGYLESQDPREKERRLGQVRAMIDDEIRNAREFVELLETSGVSFMPVAPAGESFNMYGDNLAGLVRTRVALMERHRNDLPYIDPDFMWRLPPGTGIALKDYVRY
jgi:hypothetical protein